MIQPRHLIALACLAPLWAAAQECSTKAPEKFVDFLPSFSESKAFALKRTVLPLPLLNWPGGVDIDGKPFTEPQKGYLSASEYFRWPTLNKFAQDKELLLQVRSQSPAAAIVDVTKDGSEGRVSFYFKSEGGCWYFWQYEVRAN